MQLTSSTLLQGGKYRIEKVLGQGGFGITYMAVQTGLNRKVAIKEFFMKEYCNRDAETSHVSIPSEGSKELVARFRQKFIKEAQTIAGLNHPHIIRIHDIFEENGTAYYVMEYHDHGSLSELIKQRGSLPEAEALRYIREMADALGYIHEHQMNHLDVKPGNVLLDEKGRSVLIDFGLSKRYDESGQQTSTTPVGISHGYAPMEQYKHGGVETFSPATDIYSLGATFYKLLTGQTPPDASDVFTDGLPTLPVSVSSSVVNAITQAMSPNKKNRPQSVEAFLSLLEKEPLVVDDDPTVFEVDPEPIPTPKPQPQPTPQPAPQPMPTSSKKKWLVPVLVAVVVALIILFLSKESGEEPILPMADITTVESEVVEDSVALAPIKEETPTMSSLYVTTSPSGAIVHIDGKKVGTTPIEGREVSRGRHTIKISKSGFENVVVVKQFDDKPIVLNHTLVVEQVAFKEESRAKDVIEQVTEKERIQTLAQEKAKEDEEPRVQALAEQKPKEVKSSLPSGTINGHGYVDLGLSVKWADRNVGANSPSDYGDYYAWGETNTRSEYFYDNSVTYGKKFNDIGGNSQYDAARANWGGSWRLPKKEEFQELLNKCKWIWTTQNGHSGYKFIGPNGNSIFLPAAGYFVQSLLSNAGEVGHYWSSAPYEDDRKKRAWYFCFGNIYRTLTNGGPRIYGCNVRPVSD